jgi:hypothetical protein
MPALKGRGIPAPLQGAPQSIDSETQGVAPGWHPPALSAPESAWAIRFLEYFQLGFFWDCF